MWRKRVWWSEWVRSGVWVGGDKRKWEGEKGVGEKKREWEKKRGSVWERKGILGDKGEVSSSVCGQGAMAPSTTELPISYSGPERRCILKRERHNCGSRWHII